MRVGTLVYDHTRHTIISPIPVAMLPLVEVKLVDAKDWLPPFFNIILESIAIQRVPR